MPEPVRVLIADDHTLVREGVRLLLDAQPDFQVVAEAANGREAVRLALECRPEVAILDIRMPEMDGIAALKEIHCLQPEIKIVILSVCEDQDTFFKVLRLGAAGYILKNVSSSELIDALRVIVRGDVYLSHTLATFLVNDFLKGWQIPSCNEAASPSDLLSSRELEVLQQLAEGQTNKEIAAALIISASTVQTHRTRIMEKLGLKSRSDLVKYALRHGMIRLE